MTAVGTLCSSIIWPVWPSGWVFVYELSDCELESCHINCHLYFQEMVPTLRKELLDIQANYRVWIHSETRTWHDNNMQSIKTFTTQCFFTDHLNHKTVNKKTVKKTTIGTLVEKLSNCCNYFLGFKDFLLYLAKQFWWLLNSHNLITQ